MSRQPLYGKLLGSILATVGLSCHLSAQNLITNGDFEIGPFQTNGTVANWIVSGNAHIAVRQEGSTGPTHSASFNVDGDSEGNVLSQSFSTMAGQTYVFEFDGGVWGQPSGATPQIHFQVFGAGSEVDGTVPLPIADPTDPSGIEFHHYFRTFTADSSTTTVRFTDVGLGNGSADVVLDSVSVIVAPSPTPVPTPTTLPLTNGDFETWPFNNPGTVAGWTVSGSGHIETISQGATSPIHSAGFSTGSDSLNNILSQTFLTTNGQIYTLDFDAGVFGQRSGAPLQLQAQILGSSPFFSQAVTPPDAGTYHPFLVSFMHYHFTFTANSSTATVQFTDLVGNNPFADLMLDSVSILPQPPSFIQWQMANFTPQQVADANVSGWNKDPDQDGVPNGLEYFFHTSPTAGSPSSDQNLLPRISINTTGNSSYLTLTYHRLLGWTGNAAVVAVSDNLVTWDITQSQIEQVGSPTRSGDGYTEIVTVRVKTPINQGPIVRKFLRLSLAP
ncbi:MAG: hypothetical protein JWM16_6210 [Verrucomicrobiales bacterium]|nr:hypothetical protein [Verrucomicrobiales bacterium]